MSGIIDDNGQQWEHCNECQDFVKIEDLIHESKSEKFPYGRSLCSECDRKKFSFGGWINDS